MMLLLFAVLAFGLASLLMVRGCCVRVATAALLCSIATSAAAAELSFQAMLPDRPLTAVPAIDFAAMRSAPMATAVPALSFEVMAKRPVPPEMTAAPSPPLPAVRFTPQPMPATASNCRWTPQGWQCSTPRYISRRR